MEQSEIIILIQQELPRLIAQEPLVREFILRTVSEYYASKPETESKFDRILGELWTSLAQSSCPSTGYGANGSDHCHCFSEVL